MPFPPLQFLAAHPRQGGRHLQGSVPISHCFPFIHETESSRPPGWLRPLLPFRGWGRGLRKAGGGNKHHRCTGAAVPSPGLPAELLCSGSSPASVYLRKHQGSISSGMPAELSSPLPLILPTPPFWFILFGSWFNLKINIWIQFGVQQSYAVCSGFWFVSQFQSVVLTSCRCCEQSQTLLPERAPRRT